MARRRAPAHVLSCPTAFVGHLSCPVLMLMRKITFFACSACSRAGQQQCRTIRSTQNTCPCAISAHLRTSTNNGGYNMGQTTVCALAICKCELTCSCLDELLPLCPSPPWPCEISWRLLQKAICILAMTSECVYFRKYSSWCCEQNTTNTCDVRLPDPTPGKRKNCK